MYWYRYPNNSLSNFNSKMALGNINIYSNNSAKLAEKRNSIYYTKLKFKDNIYAIGDNIMLKENETSNMIGQIIKIIEQGDDIELPHVPTIQIKWLINIL